jgi:hypothetical protein
MRVHTVKKHYYVTNNIDDEKNKWVSGLWSLGTNNIDDEKNKWVSGLWSLISRSSHRLASEWVWCMSHRSEDFESAIVPFFFDQFWVMGIFPWT